MTLKDLAALVQSMRKAQNTYFHQRGPTELNIARDWERKVDAAVQEILNPEPPGLFDEIIKELP